MSDLHAALLAAHEAGDRATLTTLYMQAAQEADTEEAKGFFLTHAFVFALEDNDPRAAEIERTLRTMGRL